MSLGCASGGNPVRPPRAAVSAEPVRPRRPGRFAEIPSFRVVSVLHHRLLESLAGGGVRMKAGTMKRGIATTILLLCVVVLPGQAGAEDPLPTVSVGDASATEGGILTFAVTLSAATTEDVTVTAGTAGGSGYTTRTAPVTIPAGQTSAPFAVESQGDDLDDSDRQFQVNLSDLSANAAPGDMSGTGTISDDDATPTLALSGPASVGETGDATYSVAIVGKSAGVVTVSYATGNGSATAPSYPSDQVLSRGRPVTRARSRSRFRSLPTRSTSSTSRSRPISRIPPGLRLPVGAWRRRSPTTMIHPRSPRSWTSR